ncbi:MAG: ABC transporter permease [Planctomycetes bacterium]|nr:ABC transporter permease [Planctomycetota bacterium]
MSPRTFLSRAGRRLLLSDYLVLYFCAAYCLAVWPFAPDFASTANVRNVLSNVWPLLAVAVGQTVVLITGGIDLSVTSIIALASVTGAWVMSGTTGLLAGHPLAVAAGIPAMLAVGVLVGLLNGLAISRLNMPPFIVTLTAMMFFSGLAVWATHSQNIHNLPGTFVELGHGGVGPVSYALIITVVLAVLLHGLLTRTTWGRWIYAVGHSCRTSRVSGVPVGTTILLAYVISGACAVVGSILYTARLETGSPVMGQRILLDVIGAAVLGGTSLFGGRGKVLWTVFGVLFITLVDNSLNMLGLSYFKIVMAMGGVILMAALIDAARHRIASGR